MLDLRLFMDPDQLIQAVRRRALELDRRGVLPALHKRQLAEVRTWRSFAHGMALHRPEPLLAERMGRRPGRWLASGESHEDAIRCGFDATRRLVIALGPLGGNEARHYLLYGDAHDELLRLRYDEDDRYRLHATWIVRGPTGLVAETVDDWGQRKAYRHDDAGRLVAVDSWAASAGAGTEPTSRWRVSYDAAGALAQIVAVGPSGERIVHPA